MLIALIVSIVIGLTGCGGGGKNSSNNTSVPNAICTFGAAVYAPGTPLLVSISVTPSPTTKAYAVEDAPPTGWTVSDIKNAGIFDTVNNKVKWGLFFDNTARTFTYTATPPAGASGIKTFSGTASFDGTNVTISGDRNIGR